MRKNKRSVTRLLALLVLCFVFVISNLVLPANVAQAAKKASLSHKSMTLPVGKMTSKTQIYVDGSWNIDMAKGLTVKNKASGATYTFSSDNTKVAKISKKGGYITGVKAGTATITCTQTLKNKKTKVGTCKVTVKAAKAEVENQIIAIGTGEFDLYDLYSYNTPMYMINYRNPDAKYTLTSSSKNFTIKETKLTAASAKDATTDEYGQEMLADFIGKKTGFGYEYNAKKAGSYKVSIKETYNKKTKTLATFTVEVKATEVAKEVNMYLGNYAYTYEFMTYPKTGVNYHLSITDYDKDNKDSNILEFERWDDYDVLLARKLGTGEIVIREGSADGAVVGKVKVHVIENKCTAIYLEKEYKTYVGDEYFGIYAEIEPYNTTDEILIESSDTSILDIKLHETDGYLVYTPLKEGVVTVTITCGDIVETVTVDVAASEDEYYDEFYDDY